VTPPPWNRARVSKKKARAKTGFAERLQYSYFPVTLSTTDPDGQLQSISAPGGEGLDYTWDATLPLSTTWSGPVAGAVSRSFDDDFRIASETIGAATINFGYDADSLLTSAGAESITRSPSHGLVTGTSLGAVTTTGTPSAFAELDAESASVSGSPIYTNAYTQRDALGRITQKAETIQGTATNLTYTYTNAGQLDVVSIGGVPTRDYDYDANGNRTHVNGQLVGSYDAQDRLTTYSGTAYTYTAAGDLATKTEAGVTTTYGYDALGNLRTVVFPDGKRIEYVIDGLNRRVGKKVCAAPCTGGAPPQLQQGFLYADQLRVVAELDGSNQLVSRFVYGSKVNVPDFMIKSGITYRILSDHLGSPRLVIDTAAGTVAQRIDYDEWGNVTQDTSPGFQPFGFTGGIVDRDTGLVRFGARDYDPGVGRWTTRDLLVLDRISPNAYLYSLNDPINRADPNGLDSRPFPLNGAARNGAQSRPIIVIDMDSGRASPLRPSESSPFFEDSDFALDGENYTKIGPNSIQINEDGSISVRNLLPRPEQWAPRPATPAERQAIDDLLCRVYGINCDETTPCPEQPAADQR
jgi:RHS repeat-associated protein